MFPSSKLIWLGAKKKKQIKRNMSEDFVKYQNRRADVECFKSVTARDMKYNLQFILESKRTQDYLFLYK